MYFSWSLFYFCHQSDCGMKGAAVEVRCAETPITLRLDSLVEQGDMAKDIYQIYI